MKKNIDLKLDKCLIKLEDEKKKEDMLRSSEEKFRTLIENIPQKIFLKDKNLVYISCNKHYADDLKIKPDEIKGKTDYEFYPKKLAEKYRKDDKKIIKAGKTVDIEEEYIKDGQKLFVHTIKTSVKDRKGKIIGILGIFWEITEQKKVADALKESEARYRSFIEVTGQLGWTTNPKGLITEDIPTWRAFTGQSYGEVKGYGWVKAIHPDDINRTKQIWENAVKTKRIYEVEYRVRRHDGVYRWFLARGIPVLKQDKKIQEWVGTCTDITEKKKAEEALKESEEKFKILYESSSDAIMTLFPPSWKFISGNPATINLFNTKDEKDFASLGPWQLSPEYQPDGELSTTKAKKMIGIAMKKGSNFFEWMHCTKEGKPFPATVLLTRINLGGKMGLQATVRDITEKKKAEEALKESEEKFRNFFENSNDAIFVADVGTRQLVDCNKKAERLLGYSRKEIIFMKADSLHPKDKIKETMEGFKKQMEGKIDIVESEVLTKDKKRVLVAINASIVNIKGRPYLQGIFRDITEEKRAQEIIKKEIERMKEIDEAKTNFLNIVSHEMKTPLTAINAHLGVMDDLKTNLSEQELLSLEAIKRNNYLLKSLIDNILELSRIEAGKFELNFSKINLEKIIKEVKSNLEILSEKKGLQLILDVGKLPEILADEMRVREILNNLISNSIKFTDKGWIKVKAEKKDNHVVISIIDTGIGISKDKINNLFQKFYQIDPSIGRRFGGTGLGLVITKQLIELQGGKITVASTYGKGSTFSVTLPINGNNLKGGAK
jgi:PAS domain S-box-containing protein